MTQDTQVLFAILVYLAFFAWIGWRRGVRAEATVFVVALVTWVLFEERGNIFVGITNLMVKFAGLLGSSLASGESPNPNSLPPGNDFVAPGAEETFLFILWIVILFITYLITSRPSFSKGKKSAWAAIFGALNGFLILAVMLPMFSALYLISGGQISEAPLRAFITLLIQFVTYLFNALRNFWEWIQPLSPLTLLIVLTVILALAALTLRGGLKAKS